MSAKMPANTTQHLASKAAGSNVKTNVGKTVGKEMPSSPGAAPAVERAELLGSLTTEQQQRTSARVIKKLRLDDAAADKKDTIEIDATPKLKEEEKETLKLTVKQRMPKAIWLTDEKSLFFEALNEYGKDFDAITSHICAKMKKKGVPDAMLKTKSQVSHFYYRTWHKLSKHVHFDENVKKVAQELYALINYGELRKKLSSVPEKTVARLGVMVASGALPVRARGRSLRVRTPVCRALRDLNQITERAGGGRVCGRCLVRLRARGAGGWARVTAAAHNPRAAVDLPLRTRLDAFLHAVQRRWDNAADASDKRPELNSFPEKSDDHEDCQEPNPRPADDGKDEERIDPENHLNLETERIILQERNLPRRLALHVGPSPSTPIHVPVLTGSEHLSSQKICFASYLERMCKDKDQPKLRTPKRQRKDSSSEKDKEAEAKKVKTEDIEPPRLYIDETAIDGIELMANIKNHQEEEGKLTEDEKEIKNDDLTEEERDAHVDLSEKEKDSFSDMEDEEKYVKSDTDNESDKEKAGKERKFKNLKVKFRIRPKKRGGSMYTLVTEPKDAEAKSPEGQKSPEDHAKPIEDQAKPSEDQAKGPEEQKSQDDHEKQDVDVEMAIRQIRNGWSVHDAGQLTIGDLYLMFGSRSKLELDYWWAQPSPPLPQPITQKHTKHSNSESEKSSTIEKDKDKLPIEKKEKIDRTPEKAEKGTDSSVEDDKEKRESDTDIFSPKNAFGQDSNDGLSGDERKNEQLLSPEQKCPSLPLASKLVNRPDVTSQTQRHLAVISDRLKRLLALAGNPHVVGTTSNINSASKCTCGHVCPTKKKTNEKAQPPQGSVSAAVNGAVAGSTPATPAPLFRHPTPIAPKPHSEQRHKPLSTTELSATRRRGRRGATVVVQRLLPLLPKLPPPNNLIPVKLVSNSPHQLPKILPKPSPAQSSNSNDSSLSHVYVLSDMSGQYYVHDADRLSSATSASTSVSSVSSSRDTRLLSDLDIDEKEEYVLMSGPPTAPPSPPAPAPTPAPAPPPAHAATITLTLPKQEEQRDELANFLPSESMSLSPSRLLRDAEGAGGSGAGDGAGGEAGGDGGGAGAGAGEGGEGWLDSSVQDFSLSSFLGHLEGRAHPSQVDSQIQSLMVDSSVDYVAKFADLAAEVTSEQNQDPLA